MINDYFVLAVKNLRHRGIRSWLTLLGIFIGVAAVVSLISLGDGLKMAVVSQFGVSDSQIITVQAGGINAGAPGSGAAVPLTESNVRAVENVPGVDYAFGQIISYGRMEFNKKLNVEPMGSTPNGENRDNAYEGTGLELIFGRLLKDGDLNKVIVGYNFYNDENIFGKKIAVGSRVLIQDEEFEVVGIAKKRGSFILDNVVIMNEDTMRALFNYGDKVDTISVKVRDSKDIERVKVDVEKVMRKERDVQIGEENFAVSTPEATLETINQVIGGVEAFVVIIASISIIVGAIGIVNTMTTAVLERRKEIGIMKAIGAKNSQVFLQFLIESGLLGLVGGIIGVLLGSLFGYLGIIGINGLIGSDIQPNVNLYWVLMALAGSFIIGSAAGVVPAMNAANQNPVEALRG